MSKFTPGPWQAVPEKLIGKHSAAGRSPEVTTVKGYLIAKLGRFKINGRDEEAEANARLIAAAPDLLEALKQAEKWLSGWASAEPYITEIRAALAKAEA